MLLPKRVSLRVSGWVGQNVRCQTVGGWTKQAPRHAFPPSLWEIPYGVFWTLVPPGSASFFRDREGAMQETKDDKKPESSPRKQSMGERLTDQSANRKALGAVMPKASDVLVYIDADGSARELSEAEKKYVDAKCSPFDGARRYIKSRYWERTACSELRGFLHRQKVPIGIPIGPAPS